MHKDGHDALDKLPIAYNKYNKSESALVLAKERENIFALHFTSLALMECSEKIKQRSNGSGDRLQSNGAVIANVVEAPFLDANMVLPTFEVAIVRAHAIKLSSNILRFVILQLNKQIFLIKSKVKKC
ncbi:hypothetical protein KIN20_017725 [Parelaphostrongylus tenuis]|uniref:Uncharacterized protein n=1 Tax=Parelaphostrongylus tenuis TaxID=148309 RepID=A0AAD5QTZ6_PARTN|nr:hypothetical protein KIN20_017725 [Parelaphostrongylus tenuis]